MASKKSARQASAERPEGPGKGAAEDEVSLRQTLREFAATDPRTLGLFRILFGVCLLIDLYRRLPDYVLYYTNEGILPNHGAIYRPMSAHLFSIFHAFSTRGEVLLAFALTALVYVLFTVGYKTRVMQVLTLVLVTSLHSRNIILENGGDVVSNLFALWTVFLPLGRRFSVDAMLSSMRDVRESGPDELNDRSLFSPDRRPIVSLAVVGVVLNLCVIYYFNVVHKDGFAWKNASAVHYVLWSDRLINAVGTWARSWVPPVGINIMTIGTLVIESSVVVLLLSPLSIRACRRVAAFEVLMLHCGFQTVGHYGMFAFFMMLHAPFFLGPEDWDELAARMEKKLPRRVVYYDAACGVCHQLARVLRRLDHLGKLRFVGNDQLELLPKGVTADTVRDTLVVSDESGDRVWLRHDAIAQCLRALPYGVYFASWLELPVIEAVAGKLYDAFAARRAAVSQALGYAACGVPQRFGGASRPLGYTRPPLLGPVTTYLREALVVVFMVAVSSQVIAENRKVPQAIKFAQPMPLAAIAQYPRLFQGWSMFAPVPPMDDGKMVVDAVTEDGRHLDPLADGGPPDFTLPDEKHALLVSQLWYEFPDRIRRDANAVYRDYVREYLVHWHQVAQRPAQDRIVKFEVWWVGRNTNPPYENKRLPSQKQLLMAWSEGKAPVQVGPGGQP